MLQRLLLITLTLFSLTASAQWQQTGSKVRYVNGLGIPTKDTAAGVAADSSQIVIRPADSSLYVKYKRTWVKVGGGTVSGTTNYVPKFTSASAIGNSQIFDNGTNVGIGTASPATDLQISRAGSSSIRLTNTSNTTNVELGISTALGFVGTNTDNSFAINTNNTERVRITNTGNVGIGTTSPNSKLDVDKGSQSAGGATPSGALLISNRTAGNGILELGVSASAIGWLQSRNSTDATYYPLSLNPSAGNVLIGTTTDNGVDKLQVNGSGYYNGSGVLGKFDGTSTNNAYIDFRTSGTAKWQLGNNAGSSNDFNLLNSATSVNSIVVNSSNQIGFNMPGGFLAANSSFEFHKAGGQGINRYFTYSSATPGVYFETRTTKNNTPGSFTATTSGDIILSFVGYGSSNSAFVFGGEFGYKQGGATSTYVPGAWEFFASSGSVANQTRLYVDGASDNVRFWTTSNERMRVATSGRVLLNTTTDNNVDQLQVNGSISGIGFKQAYVTKTGAYTATNDDYVIDCTSGTFTVTLPASSGRTGRILIIKNSGAGTITVDGNAAETIDGAATYAISVQYGTVQIMSDGTNWKIIAKF